MQYKSEKKLKTDGSRYVYRSPLGKACFQHDFAYVNQNLKTRTHSDKVSKDNAFEITHAKKNIKTVIHANNILRRNEFRIANNQSLDWY